MTYGQGMFFGVFEKFARQIAFRIDVLYLKFCLLQKFFQNGFYLFNFSVAHIIQKDA